MKNRTGEKINQISPSPFLPVQMYLNLIKGKQTLLLVYTAAFAYLITALQFTFNIFTFFWLLVALTLTIAGSTLFNMYIDRDIDAIMERTKNRPLPSGKIAPSTVMKHGFFFTGAGLFCSFVYLNLLTTITIFLGFFFDVIVYSSILKRRTKYSIIVGGIAGGLPAIAGRTALINSVDLISILLGFFVIAWIPLHILTLALLPANLKGYSDAKVPMWPVVSGERQTIYIVTFSAILSAILTLFTGILLEIDPIWLIPLLFFSSYIIGIALRNLFTPTTPRTFKLFKAASIYMALTFILLFIGLLLTKNSFGSLAEILLAIKALLF